MLLLSAGRKSPKLEALKTSPTLEPPVQAPLPAAHAPPPPVGQRSQTGAAPRSTSTATGNQKPPDLLELRKG